MYSYKTRRTSLRNNREIDVHSRPIDLSTFVDSGTSVSKNYQVRLYEFK